MAKIDVTITDGEGSAALKKGTYTVSVTTKGYDASSLDPQTYTATAEAGTGDFTVTGAGTLTINFNETGAAGGTPITAGSVVMTDSTGTIQYGSAVTIDTDGDAVFENVPFGTTADPFTLYFMQLASDDDHNVYEGVITVQMSAETLTAYVQNTASAVQSFTLKDETYGFNIPSATLSFEEE